MRETIGSHVAHETIVLCAAFIAGDSGNRCDHPERADCECDAHLGVTATGSSPILTTFHLHSARRFRYPSTTTTPVPAKLSSRSSEFRRLGRGSAHCWSTPVVRGPRRSTWSPRWVRSSRAPRSAVGLIWSDSIPAASATPRRRCGARPTRSSTPTGANRWSTTAHRAWRTSNGVSAARPALPGPQRPGIPGERRNSVRRT